MQKKIFLYVMAVLLITLAISAYFTAQTVENMHIEGIEERLSSEAFVLSQILARDMYNNDMQIIQELIARVRKNESVRITLIDKDGKVLGDTSYDPNQMENHLYRPEVQQALKGGTGKHTRYSTTMLVDFMYIAQPIYQQGNIVGVVRLSTPLQEIKGIMRSINKNIAISLIPGLILSLLLIYRISINITKPIKEIKDAAVDITQGKLDRRINAMSRDEIGELAKAIDFMAASLKDKINSIKDKNTKMEAILSSVVNGIIAVDSSKNILFINPMAQRMLNIVETDIIGKHLLQVIRNNKIDNMIKGILEDQDLEEKEIAVSYPRDMTLRLYSNVIKYPESESIIGIIIIIQDITEIRRLERVRSEFIANVSHEIKTPLTSIKGFVETLRAGALEDQETSMHFLSIIEDEADRLNRLISDILSLSELESRKARHRVESINTQSKINEIVSMLKNQASKKNIGLTADIKENVGRLQGDPDQFKQMLINLVDNAIKYTPEGGEVAVTAYNMDDRLCIRIKDNGIGISPEHIPRLFERFYRVDRARSRKVGGTGLGLAIVKHIVLQFEGSIEVQSEVGKGTEFIVTLPTKM